MSENRSDSIMYFLEKYSEEKEILEIFDRNQSDRLFLEMLRNNENILELIVFADFDDFALEDLYCSSPEKVQQTARKFLDKNLAVITNNMTYVRFPKKNREIIYCALEQINFVADLVYVYYGESNSRTGLYFKELENDNNIADDLRITAIISQSEIMPSELHPQKVVLGNYLKDRSFIRILSARLTYGDNEIKNTEQLCQVLINTLIDQYIKQHHPDYTQQRHEQMIESYSKRIFTDRPIDMIKQAAKQEEEAIQKEYERKRAERRDELDKVTNNLLMGCGCFSVIAIIILIFGAFFASCVVDSNDYDHSDVFEKDPNTWTEDEKDYVNDFFDFVDENNEN